MTGRTELPPAREYPRSFRRVDILAIKLRLPEVRKTVFDSQSGVAAYTRIFTLL